MSRFHGIRRLKSVSSYEYVSLAIRLPAYGGCLANTIHRESEEEQQDLEVRGQRALTRAVAFDGSREALEGNPLFAGLGAFSTAPAE